MPPTAPPNPAAIALRGPTLSFHDDPFMVGDDAAMRYEPDGLVIVEDGVITAAGDYAALRDGVNPGHIMHYPDSLIMPGFIDTHVHYPQTQIIGAYGAQLIDWLNKYTFVAEQQFSDPNYARAVSDLFLDEILRCGTTTAAVYCTVHPVSADAFFTAASKRNMRVIAGKVLMDRNAPDALTDTAQSGYDDSLALIEQWHGKGRLGYAITPRFAPTSTPAQLEAAGALWKRHPDTYMQTHLSENRNEITWVRELFPDRTGYLDVYAHYGLTGERSIFGHSVHLNEDEWRLLADTGSSIAHCPSSNAFLGSGLFDFARAMQPAAPALPVRTGLATDVGGGTGLSMLKTMGEAYKIGQLGGFSLSAPKAFYMATLGAARALRLEDRIGSLQAGREADVIVLDMKSTPLIDFRMKHCNDLEEALFVQMIMADDRATRAVYIAGKLAYDRTKKTPQAPDDPLLGVFSTGAY